MERCETLNHLDVPSTFEKGEANGQTSRMKFPLQRLSREATNCSFTHLRSLEMGARGLLQEV